MANSTPNDGTGITTTWEYNDGGRKAAGFKGSTRDCTTRAIAIAAELPYHHADESHHPHHEGDPPR